MITNGICLDKRINSLSDDTSRLAFTWLVTFADCEGRTYGDPAAVRSLLFPRRDDVSIEQMACYLREWADVGLIVQYQAGGDQWIWFPAFEKNQVGLRKEREPKSVIPPPPMPEGIQQTSGELPTQEKRREVKLSEEKRSEENTASDDAGFSDPPQKPPSQAMFDALILTCNVVDVTPRFQGWANRKCKSLFSSGISPPDILAFRDYWLSSEWRAKNQLLNWTAFTTRFDAWLSQGKPDCDPAGGNGDGRVTGRGRDRPAQPGGFSDDAWRSILEKNRRRLEAQAAQATLPDLRGSGDGL
jgi:hypothetical protein